MEKEDAVFIMSPKPVEKKNVPGLHDLAEKLKINSSEIDDCLPISVIIAGLSTLLVPIKSLKSILDISPE